EFATDSYSGEILEVDTVSGTTINLVSPVRGAVTDSRAYPAIATEVIKVDPVQNVGVSDLSIDGGGVDKRGIIFFFQNGDGVTVSNVHVKNNAEMAFRINACRNVTISGGSVANLSGADTSN